MYDWPSSTPTTVAGSCSPMARSATLTMVESRKTIPDPRTTATSVQVRRVTGASCLRHRMVRRGRRGR